MTTRAHPRAALPTHTQIKSRLGGRVKLIVSGGAPLAPHVEEFLRVCMCSAVAQARLTRV